MLNNLKHKIKVTLNYYLLNKNMYTLSNKNKINFKTSKHGSQSH